jgi:hypothetical protein
VQVEGAENVLVEGCLFERIDGNGVMISGYNRNTSIIDNEFHLVGENGVVSWSVPCVHLSKTCSICQKPVP